MQHALNNVHVPDRLLQVYCHQASRCSTLIDAALHRAVDCLAAWLLLMLLMQRVNAAGITVLQTGSNAAVRDKSRCWQR